MSEKGEIKNPTAIRFALYKILMKGCTPEKLMQFARDEGTPGDIGRAVADMLTERPEGSLSELMEWVYQKYHDPQLPLGEMSKN